MPTLADQVLEMMRILEVVDPRAAAQIKGSTLSFTPRAELDYAAPAAPSVRPVVSAPYTAKNAAAQEIVDRLAQSELTPEKMIQGIIWSELLSKPVSRRRQRRL